MLLFQAIASDVLRFEASGWWYEEIAKVHLTHSFCIFRKDQLDSALLRPGRFDTSVEVPVPDLNGRLAILGLYLGKVKHDMSVDVEQLAKLTFGFTGAELENMVNTAAIKAASQGTIYM